MISLARSDGAGTRRNAATLAAELGASASHVHALMSGLVAAGFVEAHRGRGGGLEITAAGLAASARDVVLTVIGEERGGHEPPGREGTPGVTGGRLSEALESAREAYLDALGAYSIAALADSGPGGFRLSGTPTIGSQLH